MKFTTTLRKKLPPGVLKKYREGLPTPSVINDIAGVSLHKHHALGVSPRYVDNELIGPLVFHHLMYGGGANGPHRPLVFRGALRGHELGSWKRATQAMRLASTASVGHSGSFWVDHQNDMVDHRPPAIPFALGTWQSTSYLCCRDSIVSKISQRAVATLQRTVPRENTRSLTAGPREPWRVGTALDPVVPALDRSLSATVPGSATESTDRDTFLIPWVDLVLDVDIPDAVLRMCREANRKRLAKQKDAGVLGGAVDAVAEAVRDVQEGGGSRAESTQTRWSIRVQSGDIVMMPMLFRWEAAVIVGHVATDPATGVPRLSHSGDVTASLDRARGKALPLMDEGGDLRFLMAKYDFKQLPRLTPLQQGYYQPSDYATAAKLDAFYRNGGNSTTPQYR